MKEFNKNIPPVFQRQPPVTVVIPNFNGMKYLPECLRTLYESPGILEVILVDNGSEDKSPEWVRENYPQVRIISLKENTGFSAAVNLGIKASVTEYVILLNNDTVMDSGFAVRLVEAMETSDRIFSAGAKMLSLKEPDKIDDAGDFYCALGWAYARGKGKPEGRFHEPAEIFSSCAGAAVYRKSIFDEIGYFDEEHFAYLEDIDVGYRARIWGYRNVFVPKAVVYHAGSGSSGSRYNEFKAGLSSRNSVYLVWKNMPALQILLNLPFLIPGFLIKILFFVRKGMGRIYVKGLWQGVKLSVSGTGRAHKVPFRLKNLGNYIRIQWQLWRNIFRML